MVFQHGLPPSSNESLRHELRSVPAPDGGGQWHAGTMQRSNAAGVNFFFGDMEDLKMYLLLKMVIFQLAMSV